VVFEIFRDGSNTPSRNQVVPNAKPASVKTTPTSKVEKKANPAEMTLPELESYSDWLNQGSVLPALNNPR